MTDMNETNRYCRIKQALKDAHPDIPQTDSELFDNRLSELLETSWNGYDKDISLRAYTLLHSPIGRTEKFQWKKALFSKDPDLYVKDFTNKKIEFYKQRLLLKYPWITTERIIWFVLFPLCMLSLIPLSYAFWWFFELRHLVSWGFFMDFVYIIIFFKFFACQSPLYVDTILLNW